MTFLGFRQVARRLALIASFLTVFTTCGRCQIHTDGTPPAYLIRVTVPIRGPVDDMVRRQVTAVLPHLLSSRDRPVLVFEFLPSSKDTKSDHSEFERCLALARFLTSDALSKCRTVAYVPQTALGHAALPIMACEEIVISPTAEIGDIQCDESDRTMMATAYRDITQRRATIPSAVAVAMLDPDTDVQQATLATGSRFMSSDELKAFQSDHVVLEVKTVVRQGDLCRLDGNEMRMQYGFASHLVNDLTDVATSLGVDVGDLVPDPSRGRDWQAVEIDIRGPITKSMVERVERMIDDTTLAGTNLICLWIDSPGGSCRYSLQLAHHIAALDPNKVRTVGFVPIQTLGDAMAIAVACDQLVTTNTSQLGGPGAYQPADDEMQDMARSLRDICQRQSRRWSVPVALINPDLAVYQWTQKGTEITEFASTEEAASLPDAESWEQGAPITTAGKVLELTGSQAHEYGISSFVVDDFGDLVQHYRLDTPPQVMQPSWAHDFISFLASPYVAATLLFFAGLALIVELSAPGIGGGAFISTLCFVLFFWAQFFHGTAGWLEIFLFSMGVICIGVELFLLPGVGVFGFGGGALVVVSLVLASQTFVLPQNEYQFEQLAHSLLTVFAAGCGIIVGLMILRKYIDQAPVLRRMLLLPPQGTELAELEKRESLVNYDHLVGQVGVAATAMMPSGKALFGKSLVDVTSRSTAIEKGDRVRVVEVTGNRVLVVPAD